MITQTPPPPKALNVLIGKPQYISAAQGHFVPDLSYEPLNFDHLHWSDLEAEINKIVQLILHKQLTHEVLITQRWDVLEELAKILEKTEAEMQVIRYDGNNEYAVLTPELLITAIEANWEIR